MVYLGMPIPLDMIIKSWKHFEPHQSTNDQHTELWKEITILPDKHWFVFAIVHPLHM